MKHSIRGLVVVLLLAGILYAGWSFYEDFLTRGQKPPVSTLKLNQMEESGVPEFSMQTIDEKVFRLSDFQGKIVIVNFWASWCEPCVKEFPSLIRLLKEFEEEVVLLAISSDYTRADLTGFTKAFDVAAVPNFLVSWDPEQKIGKLFGTAVLPESYIIGNDRQLIRKVAGVEEWDSPAALSFFKEIVEVNKSGKRFRDDYKKSPAQGDESS